MRLSRVEIRNFRSIANTTISFDPPCRILVGINESGKSNILKALALLDTARLPTPADLRDFAPDEDPDQEASVCFVFIMDRDERIANYRRALPKVLATDLEASIISWGNRRLSLAQAFDLRNEGLYRVDLRGRYKSPSSWELDDSFGVLPGWKKPSKACPPNYPVQKPDGTSATLRAFELLQERSIPDVPAEYLQDIEREDVSTLAHQQIVEQVGANLPSCIFWSYSEENLLPAQIALDAFANNPSICAPLRHMFWLAEINDIAVAISEARLRPNGLRNLLNRVAARATKHMHAVWKEYRGIKIELALNGPSIDATIRDEYNLYDFSRRSDGFKRFVTFLLMVSARVKTQQLVNTLYLHDEPDVSLHPSGARYLRDELIKISKRNYVVFSSHSIFMVDRELLRRHLIVEKKAEVTTIREVDESNIVDEEVIYNALGYSVFENLKTRNVIFEGWRDKRLFQVALKNLPVKLKAIKSTLSGLGLCHARGVKDIGRITPMLELAGRKWIVVSDGDRPAVEQQKQYDGEGPWYRYDELLPDRTAISSEDFIKPEAFKSIGRRLASEHAGLGELPIDALAGNDPKMNVLRGWLHRGGLTGDDFKRSLDAVKEQLFAELKPSQIEDKYYDFLSKLHAKLKA